MHLAQQSLGFLLCWLLDHHFLASFVRNSPSVETPTFHMGSLGKIVTWVLSCSGRIIISESNVFLVSKINTDAEVWVPSWNCSMGGLIQTGFLEDGRIYAVHSY